jgi:hypothetical protein
MEISLVDLVPKQESKLEFLDLGSTPKGEESHSAEETQSTSNDILDENTGEKQSQNDPFDVIVLSGGGIKGLLELGSIQYFYEIGKYDYNKILCFYGTSIGSPICFLLNLGMTSFDIFREIYYMASFISAEIKNLLHLPKTLGIFKINTFIEKIINLADKFIKERYKDFYESVSLFDENTSELFQLKKKLKNEDFTCKNLTFRELKLLTGKILKVNTTNLSKMTKEIYSDTQTPNSIVIDILSKSCNLPLFFEKIVDDGGYFVDGGLGCYCLIDDAYNDYPLSKILCICIDFDIKLSTETNLDFKEYLYRILMYRVKNDIQKIKDTYSSNKLITLIVISSDELFFRVSVDKNKKMDYFVEGYNLVERRFKSSASSNFQSGDLKKH